MIDERDIHIGSHLRVWNKRVRVCDIMGDLIGYELPDGGYEQSLLDRFEPIPITEILLAELGFEKKSYNDIEQWSNWIKNGVGVHCFKGKSTYVQFSNSDTLNECYMPCEYLHELEFFYYHVFKKELIEE